MTKLVRVATIRAALSLSENPERDAMLSAAAEAATPALASYLNDDFSKSTDATAFFEMVGPGYLEYEGSMYVLELPKGHVEAGSVTATYSSKAKSLVAGDGTAIAAGDIVVDHGRGYVTILAPIPWGYWVSLEYTAGFDETADTVGTRYKAVPSYLQQAARLFGIHVYNSSREVNNADTPYSAPEMPAILGPILASRRRNRQDCVRAAWRLN